MIRPAQVLVGAALRDLRACGESLLELGWDCDLVVEIDPRRPDEPEAWAVSVVIRLPTFKVPVEAGYPEKSEMAPKEAGGVEGVPPVREGSV